MSRWCPHPRRVTLQSATVDPSQLSAGDALWILEGLLQNPQLIDALGGEPDGAGQMPPGVKVFEIVVAHALEAWQGHKSQGQAYLR